MGLESNYWVTPSQLTKTSATSKSHYFVLRLNIAHFLLKTTCLEAWDLRKLNIFGNRGTLMLVYCVPVGFDLFVSKMLDNKECHRSFEPWQASFVDSAMILYLASISLLPHACPSIVNWSCSKESGQFDVEGAWKFVVVSYPGGKWKTGLRFQFFLFR